MRLDLLARSDEQHARRFYVLQVLTDAAHSAAWLHLRWGYARAFSAWRLCADLCFLWRSAEPHAGRASSRRLALGAAQAAFAAKFRALTGVAWAARHAAEPLPGRWSWRAERCAASCLRVTRVSRGWR